MAPERAVPEQEAPALSAWYGRDKADPARRATYQDVLHVWLIDPLARSLEGFALEAGAWRLLGTWAEGDQVRLQPFDVIELDLRVLWADVRLRER
jgi:hypothetical protein